jgi:hypothetical protein
MAFNDIIFAIPFLYVYVCMCAKWSRIKYERFPVFKKTNTGNLRIEKKTNTGNLSISKVTTFYLSVFFMATSSSSVTYFRSLPHTSSLCLRVASKTISGSAQSFL